MTTYHIGSTRSMVWLRLSALSLFIIISFSGYTQNMGINANGALPDSSAMLDVSSSTKGFLMPRMTFAQRNDIVPAANGLMVYQTDGQKGLYIYDDGASSWKHVLDSAQIAALLSAAPSIDSVLASGNDADGDSILKLGAIGIGTNSPQSQIDVNVAADSASMTVRTNSASEWSGLRLGTDQGNIGWLWTGGSSFATSIYQNRLALETQTGNGEGINITANDGDIQFFTGTHGNVPTMVLDQNSELQVEGRGEFDTLSIEGAFTFPTSDGTNGDVLTTDGSGSVSWGAPSDDDWTVSGGIVSNTTERFGFGTSSMPANYFSEFESPTGSTYAIGLSIDHNYNGAAQAFGLVSDISSASSGQKFGYYNTVSYNATQSNGVYGTFNNMVTNGTAVGYGSYSQFTGSGSGIRYGFYSTGEDYNYFSGRVGIGVTTPIEELTVGGSIYTDTLKISGASTTNGGYEFPAEDGSNGEVLTTDGAGNVSWGTAAGDSDWTVNGTDIYNANADQVGIGTGSSIQGGTKFHVESSGSANQHTMRIENGYSGSSTSYSLYIDNNTGSSAGSKYGMYHDLTSTSGTEYGFFNFMNGAKTSATARSGIWQNISFSSGATGTLYGQRNNLTNPGSGDTYGTYYSMLMSGSTGDNYAVYVNYSSTGSGENYGVYASGEDKNYFSGRMGIGTTTPDADVEVAKDTLMVKTPNNFSGTHLIVEGARHNSGSAAATIDLRNLDSSNGNSSYSAARIETTNSGSSDDGDLRFYTTDDLSSSLAMTIDKDGNVGVGTSSPSEEMHVEGDLLLNRNGSTNVTRTLTLQGAGALGSNIYGKILFKGYDSSSGSFEYEGAAITARNLGSVNHGAMGLWTNDGTTLNEWVRIDNDGDIFVDPNGVGGASLNIDGDLGIDGGELNQASTGGFNLLPVAMARISHTTPSVLSGTGNVSVSSSATGTFTVTISGHTANVNTDVVHVALIGSTAGEITVTSASGSYIVYTRNSLGVLANMHFSIIVYSP